jgi:hypothetical protein
LRLPLTDVFLHDVAALGRANGRIDGVDDLLDVVHQHDASAATLVARLDDPNVERAVESELRPQQLHLVENPLRLIVVGIERCIGVLLHLELAVLVRQQVVVREKDVPVVLPNLDVALDVDVVVEAAVDKVLAAVDGELNAGHRHASIVRHQEVRALLLVLLGHPTQQANARSGAKVVDELGQLLRIEHVVAARKVCLGLALLVVPVKVLQRRAETFLRRKRRFIKSIDENVLIFRQVNPVWGGIGRVIIVICCCDFGKINEIVPDFSRRTHHSRSMGECSRNRDMMLRSHFWMWLGLEGNDVSYDIWWC